MIAFYSPSAQKSQPRRPSTPPASPPYMDTPCANSPILAASSAAQTPLLQAPEETSESESESGESQAKCGFITASCILRQYPHPAISLKSLHVQSLQTWLQSARPSLRSALVCMKQLASLMQHCHGLKIAMPYLTASAITTHPGPHGLLPQVSVTPSLMCQVGPAAQLCRSPRTSIAYAAPELLRNKVYHALRADIWVLGVVFFIIVAGTYPFVAQSPLELLEKICHQDVVFPHGVRADIKSLIKMMLAKEPAQRPSIAAVVNRCSDLLRGKISANTHRVVVVDYVSSSSCDIDAGCKRPVDDGDHDDIQACQPGN